MKTSEIHGKCYIHIICVYILSFSIIIAGTLPFSRDDGELHTEFLQRSSEDMDGHGAFAFQLLILDIERMIFPR